MRVMEINEYETLKLERSEIEIGNLDPRTFIEKEQMLAKKKHLEVIQMK